MSDGRTLEDEIEVADAHPRGARPFRRNEYVVKFTSLASQYASQSERERFLATCVALPTLGSGRLGELHVTVPARTLDVADLSPGLFERRGH